VKYFTIIGNHDAISLEQPGIGAALTIFFKYKKYLNGIYIFSFPDKPHFPYMQTAEKIKRRMEAEAPGIDVLIIEMNIENPIDFNLVYKIMLDETQTLFEKTNIIDEPKIINITSGTPTMTTCWVILHKAGLIPNSILVQSFEPFFQRKYGKTCQEVSLNIDDLPKINSPSKAKRALNRVNQENIILRNEKVVSETDDAIPGLIGKSQLIRDIKEQILQLVDANTHVLILGEQGTGKEVIAKAIWDVHRRDIDKNFNPFDCGQFDPNLIISELFGYEKGAFTGANQTKKGIIESTDGKMLYLDEIGNIPIENQGIFLRFLQFGDWKRIGSTKTHSSKIQVIAATNKDIYNSVVFRADLKDRFHEIIKIPPLRNRMSDIPMLTEFFLSKINKNVFFDSSVYKHLEKYSWPGNVRQLEMWVSRMCRKYQNRQISWVDIPDILKPDELNNRTVYDFPELPVDSMNFITQLRLHALEVADNNKAKADRLLGLKNGTLKQWIHQREKRFSK
jgi:two-component system, NtrC family, response regulator HydG